MIPVEVGWQKKGMWTENAENFLPWKYIFWILAQMGRKTGNEDVAFPILRCSDCHCDTFCNDQGRNLRAGPIWPIWSENVKNRYLAGLAYERTSCSYVKKLSKIHSALIQNVSLSAFCRHHNTENLWFKKSLSKSVVIKRYVSENNQSPSRSETASNLTPSLIRRC